MSTPTEALKDYFSFLNNTPLIFTKAGKYKYPDKEVKMNSDDTYHRDFSELDPDGKEAHELGSKLDAGKVKVFTHLLTYFPRALGSVCQVSEFGARKYTRIGWAHVSDGVERYSDAMCRHILAESEGPLDKDSGLRHAAQVAWNALARLELMIKEEEVDEAPF